jgi:hypothetical protein
MNASAARRWQAGAALLAAAMLASSEEAALARRAGFVPPPMPSTAAAAEGTITRHDLRASVRYLASDDLGGRAVGHPGNDAAVRYLAAKLESAGLRPGAAGDFLQPIPLETSLLNDANRVEIPGADGTAQHVWNAGDEFYPMPGSPSADVTAPLAYLGEAPATDGEEPAARGADLAGHVAVVIAPPRAGRGSGDTAPAAIPPAADPASVEAQVRRAAERGAVALVVVGRERQLRGFQAAWPAAPAVRNVPYRLADDRLPVPAIRVAATVGAVLFDVDRQDPVAAIGRVAEDPSAASGLLDRRMRLLLDIDTRAVTAHNVLGLVEGRDPERRHEMIAIGAHLDHDGIDEDGRIYNGADDDASGSAAVVELADAFATAARRGHLPRASILFALWNAEEKGLLGSRHFVARRDPEAPRVVAGLNLDMIGRHENIPRGNDPRFPGLQPRSAAEARRLVHLVGYTFSPDLAKLVKEEAPRSRLVVAAEYDANPINLLRRSDHWPFLLAGIPALFLTTGLHPDYHTPDDDADRIDYDKLERIARLTFRVAWRVADAEAPPRMVSAPTPDPEDP